MNNNKKILLGSKDVITRTNEDIYIDVELTRTIDEINKERINNDFNLFDQFNTERNDSLKFCIYGTVESKVADTTNLKIKISSTDNDNLYSPKITNGAVTGLTHVIETIPLSKNGILSKNIFDYDKASYYFLFELKREDIEKQLSGVTIFPHVKSMILEIDDSGRNLFDVLEFPIFYLDSSGDIVEYGTETTELNEQGEATEINNDFPFLYDTHWIKSNFNIIREPFVSFETEEGEEAAISVLESTGDIEIGVSLDFPSKFGREQIEIGILEDNTVKNPENDYVYSPKSISWERGEQVKNFKVSINDDLYTEEDESVVFKLFYPINTQLQNPSAFTLTILNDDLPSIANFEQSFQEITEENKTLSIKIKLNRTPKIPNQSINVIIDETQTTAIFGEDYTGTFIKNVVFLEGEIEKEFTINIIEDEKYELDKKIVLKLQDPTQNMEIGNIDEHTINIIENIIPKHVRYYIPFKGGVGDSVFRQKGDNATKNEKLKWKFDKGDGSVIVDFTYAIKVINRGVGIVFNGTEIQTGGIVKYELIDYPRIFDITLPSNFVFNQSTKQYDKAKYEFEFSHIHDTGDGNETDDKKTFNDVIISAAELPAGVTNSAKTYSLVTQISNIKTRYKDGECKDSVKGEEITMQTNGTLFLTKNQTKGTKIDWRKFLSSPVSYTCEYNNPSLPLKKV